MYSKILSTAALALAASTLVSAQTFTECDPTKKDCPPDPAFAQTATIDLTQGEPKTHFKNLAGTQVEYDGSKGAVFTIRSEGDAPTMASHKYIFFGRIDVTLQAAPGAGIVTSFVLQSDDLDEIDLEWVGGDNAQVQTNYFSKGDTTTYDRGRYHRVTNPTGQTHVYSIDWTKDYVKWYIDGELIRVLTYAEAKGGSTFPQTPMQIKFGTWVAGKQGASKGTVDWAGGYANFANAPFIAHYKEIKITDYQGGAQGAKQYIYSDRSGTWQSIKIDTVNGGVVGADLDSTTSASSTASASASETTLTTATNRPSNATAAITSGPSTTGAGSGSGSGARTSTTSPPVPASAARNLVGGVAVSVVALLAANLFVV